MLHEIVNDLNMLISRISGCKGSANHENKQIYLNNSQMPTALKATKQTKTKQKTVKMLCSSDNNWQTIGHWPLAIGR